MVSMVDALMSREDQIVALSFWCLLVRLYGTFTPSPLALSLPLQLCKRLPSLASWWLLLAAVRL